MTDFGITPPKAMLGMFKTDPKVTVTFETVLAMPPTSAYGQAFIFRPSEEDTIMTPTLRLATALTALLALAAPATAQQDRPAPPATVPAATDRRRSSRDRPPTTAAGRAGRGRRASWKKGRADRDSVPARRRTSAASTRSRPRRTRAPSSRASSSTSAPAFTSQVQNLVAPQHGRAESSSTASTRTSSPTSASASTTRRPTCTLNAQLAPGIRVALTSYLSSRHHNETWVKDGYIQIDESPIDFAPLKMLIEIATVRVGHMEINYGDAHFRRSDNGNAIYNPFVGNYIMDAFTTEIGGEVYLKTDGVIAMGVDHRRRDPRHGAHARAARPGAHRQARLRPADEPRTCACA